MAIGFQVSFDAHDPAAQARFWALALGYIEQPPPDGFDSWEAFADQMQIPEENRNVGAAVDPEGRGSRLLFQKVPEDKTAKNRMHLDVTASAPDHDWEKVTAHVEKLTAAGATLVEERHDQMSRWVVMLDPEGNEFCVQ